MTMKRQYSPSGASEARRLRARTLFLIDLENAARSCDLSLADVARTQARIMAAVPRGEYDHTVVAVSHHNALAAYFGWSGPTQRLARSGQDGADTALLEVVADHSWVASRYDRVVVASGDHAFAEAVAALKATRLHVIVIAPDTGLSARMKLAAGPDRVPLGSPIPANVTSLFRATMDTA
jgi:hypothetical protein